jgi:hypothetical protein
MTFSQNHFFRNGRNVYYVNRKHNALVFDGKICHLHSIKTRHYGYDPSVAAGKADRDKRLLRKMLEENPNDYRPLFWLAQTHAHYGKDYEKSFDLLAQYINIASDKKDFNRAAYVSASEMARHCGKREESFIFLRKGIDRYPNDIDLNFLMIRSIIVDKQAGNLQDHIERYLCAYDDYVVGKTDGRFTWFYNKDSLAWILHKAVIHYFHKGLSYLGTFHKNLPSVSNAARIDIDKCMQADLDKIGISLK